MISSDRTLDGFVFASVVVLVQNIIINMMDPTWSHLNQGDDNSLFSGQHLTLIKEEKNHCRHGSPA